jgi:diguanylate cyclase (GGDEF)-like protein/PAS domain S-box-containing protein
MTALSRAGRVALAIGALLLFAFLFFNLRALDPAQHDRVASRLRELQALDSELNESVLKLRYGVAGNYDPISSVVDRLGRMKRELETGPDAISGRGDSRIDAAMAKLGAALQEKQDLVERFKTNNALLRNSVLYLPLSVEKAAAEPAMPPSARGKLQAVLHEALLLQGGITRGSYTEVLVAIGALELERHSTSPAVRAAVERVLTHAEHVTEHQQRMDTLIPRITSGANGHLGAELTRAYNSAFERDLARSNALRFMLLLASLALLTCAGYAFIRLRENAKTLAESESRYRSVVAAIAEGIVVRDDEGRISACNASAERILGRSIDKLRGHVMFDPEWKRIREDGSVFPVEEIPAAVALRTGAPQTNVVVGYHRQDDSVLWLSFSAQPLFIAGAAKPSGVVTSLVDITQRKQARARLDMEHAITRVLATANAVPAAMAEIIRIACETLDFAYGSCWERDGRTDAVREVATWSVDDPKVREFAALTSERQRSLRPTGLMGRVWGAGEPIWLTDVAREPTLERREIAERAGLHGAFVFPIVFDGEVFAAIECFSRGTQAPDDVFLESARAIGAQIGLFMQRQSAEARLEFLAHHDALTQLPNRVLFHDRCNETFRRARRHGNLAAVLFVDLDRFKTINDSLGHEIGDLLLQAAAARLRECVRASDTVARAGGDEFTILLEELHSLDDAAAIAQVIRTALARPFVLAGHELFVSASIGIGCFPADGTDTQTLLKNADAAMYRAKEEGRNAYRFFSPQMNEQAPGTLVAAPSIA